MVRWRLQKPRMLEGEENHPQIWPLSALTFTAVAFSHPMSLRGGNASMSLIILQYRSDVSLKVKIKV